MNLSPYLESVRTGVQNAAALADENTQQVAYKLGTAVESSTRLALISALSDAAGVISAELAPSSVELRMSGDDPEFVVTVSSPSTEPAMLLPEAGSGQEETTDPAESDEDEPLSRISLRLPASVKARVDEQAAKDGISTNAWLVRAVMDALADRPAGGAWPAPPPPPPPPAGGFFGPGGPFGPHGVFGPGGVFGAGGPFGSGKAARHSVHHEGDEWDRPGGDRRPNDHEHGGRGGSLQGWAR